MSRRTALAFIIISLNLMACCCGGGVPVQPRPPVVEGAKPKPVEFVADKPDAKPAPTPSGFVPSPDPVFVFNKPELPPRKFGQILSSLRSSSVDAIKVELLSGEISPLRLSDGTKTADRFMAIRLNVYSAGNSVAYKPWHAMSVSSRNPMATDEHGVTYAARFSASDNWPVDCVKLKGKIDPGKSINDLVVFAAPSPKAQEVDIKLPGENINILGQWFTFKIGRSFFAKLEDERLTKLEHDRQLNKFKADLAAKHEEEKTVWLKAERLAQERKDAAEKQRLAFEAANEAAKQKAEQDRLAARAARREEERLQAIEDSKPIVTRANYRKIEIGMPGKDVEKILGYGKENGSSGAFQYFTWRSRYDEDPVTINITFRYGVVYLKTIID